MALHVELITPPSPDAIFSLLDKNRVKANLRIKHSIQDKLIEDWILTAHSHLDGLQGYVRRPILPAVYQVQASRLDGRLRIPFPKVTVLTGRYYSAPSTWTDLDVTGFRAVTIEKMPYLDFYGTIPTQTGHKAYGLDLTVRAGEPTNSPARFALKQAMMLLASHWYRNREASYADARQTLTNKGIAYGVESLLGRWKVPLFPGDA